MAKNSQALRMSDEAVKAKTGRTWPQWFAVLDREGADRLEHKALAELLYTKHKVPMWWCQMVTVGYEQARGKRKVHERPDGWEVSVSRTMALPVGPIYKAWVEEKTRKRWLPSRFEITTATANKWIRIKWNERERVEVMFYPKGKGKTQTTVQHRRLAEAGEVEKMRECWRGAVGRLERMLGQ
jgi:uncharacterized protein YndB with AHSA1/START domain